VESQYLQIYLEAAEVVLSVLRVLVSTVFGMLIVKVEVSQALRTTDVPAEFLP
jgi:hypothetical protein